MQGEYKKCHKRKVLISESVFPRGLRKTEESHPFQGQREGGLEVMLMKRKQIEGLGNTTRASKQCSMWCWFGLRSWENLHPMHLILPNPSAPRCRARLVTSVPAGATQSLVVSALLPGDGHQRAEGWLLVGEHMHPEMWVQVWTPQCRQ